MIIYLLARRSGILRDGKYIEKKIRTAPNRHFKKAAGFERVI